MESLNVILVGVHRIFSASIVQSARFVGMNASGISWMFSLVDISVARETFIYARGVLEDQTQFL
jgi:hypothetical protein